MAQEAQRRWVSIGGVNMGNGERSGPGGRHDWRVRFTTMVGVAACMSGAMLLGPVAGINGFWPGMLAIALGANYGRHATARPLRLGKCRPYEMEDFR